MHYDVIPIFDVLFDHRITPHPEHICGAAPWNQVVGYRDGFGIRDGFDGKSCGDLAQQRQLCGTAVAWLRDQPNCPAFVVGPLDVALSLQIGEVLVDSRERIEPEIGGDFLEGRGVTALPDITFEVIENLFLPTGQRHPSAPWQPKKGRNNIPEHTPNRKSPVVAKLDQIVADTRYLLPALRDCRSDWELAAKRAAPPVLWRSAFDGGDVAVIAEIKRRSPSAGAIAPSLDPVSHAQAYVAGGARAVSVLTDSKHFGGSPEDLARVRQAVPVPVLRKDFILDPVQLYQSRAIGASAVLLIVRALAASELEELSRVAKELGMSTLVEVHTVDELESAMRTEPTAVGVNSRDLASFEIDIEGIREVLHAIPNDVIAVAESGLGTRADVERVAAWGADAVLIGSALARAGAPRELVSALTGVSRIGRC